MFKVLRKCKNSNLLFAAVVIVKLKRKAFEYFVLDVGNVSTSNQSKACR